jgi:hypothetical protein
MPIFGYVPWLPRVVFQLSPWATWATNSTVQPPAWPSWEPSDHQSGLKADGTTLSLLSFECLWPPLKRYNHQSDCLKNHDLSGLDPDSPSWRFAFPPLESLFRMVPIYIHCAFIVYFYIRWVILQLFNYSCLTGSTINCCWLSSFHLSPLHYCLIPIWLLLVILKLQMCSRYFNPVRSNYYHHHLKSINILQVQDSPTSILEYCSWKPFVAIDLRGDLQNQFLRPGLRRTRH